MKSMSSIFSVSVVICSLFFAIVARAEVVQVKSYLTCFESVGEYFSLITNDSHSGEGSEWELILLKKQSQGPAKFVDSVHINKSSGARGTIYRGGLNKHAELVAFDLACSSGSHQECNPLGELTVKFPAISFEARPVSCSESNVDVTYEL